MHFCSDCQWHKIETRMNFSVPTLFLLGVFLDSWICIQSHIFQLLRLPPDSSSCLCSYSISGFCKRRIALTCIYAHFGDEEFLMAPLLLVHYEWELCSLQGFFSALASFIADECFRNRTPRRRCPQSVSVTTVHLCAAPAPGLLSVDRRRRWFWAAFALFGGCIAYLLIDRITCFYLNCTYLKHLPLTPSVGKLGLGND